MGWALATITTVGYGEAYSITTAGKMFAGVVILVGLGIVAIPTGLCVCIDENKRRIRAKLRPKKSLSIPCWGSQKPAK
jgi:voltage-gated potassium channel